MTSLLEVVVLGLASLVLLGPMFARFLGRRRPADEVDDAYEPTVTVVTPMYNEGESIRQTIRSLLAQDYPAHKLDVIVVDDCSTDDSYEQATSESRHQQRVRILRNPINIGKRCSINRAVRESTSEIIVSVDSDVVLEPGAVRKLVRRFSAPRIAAVGGRVDILNKRENWLTRMQAVKYYYGYHFLKRVERACRTVMCLSGCLTAYRRSVLLELEPLLEGRNILGLPIKYGEDRFLTRQIVKAGYQTTMALDAVCRTKTPEKLGGYFAQQLRWRRSNIVDYFGGLSHVWRLHPVVAIHYYSLFALFLAYPALLLQSLMAGTFWQLMALHLGVASALGVIYRLHVRRLPPDQRVSAIDFLPITVIMPVSYAVLTPLAFLTLDSAKWETRGHQVPAEVVPLPSRPTTPRARTTGTTLAVHPRPAPERIASLNRTVI